MKAEVKAEMKAEMARQTTATSKHLEEKSKALDAKMEQLIEATRYIRGLLEAEQPDRTVKRGASRAPGTSTKSKNPLTV